MMKKVLILTFGFDGGGLGKVSALMENFLNESYETVTLVFFADKGIFDIKGKKINIGALFNFNFPLRGYIELVPHIIKTIKYIKKEKPDIVIGAGTYCNFLGLIAKKFLKFKLLLSQHDFITYRKTHSSILSLNYLSFFMIKKLIGKHKIVCVSNEVKFDVIKNYGIKENQAITIYNGLNLDEINELGKEEISIKDEFIINIGALITGKNQELLIKAYSKSRIKDKYKLLLLGDGFMEKYLKELCKELDVEKSVIFAGFDKNPYKYLKKASLFCFTSLTEALPTVLIESLILDVPIITVPVTGANEILDNGKFGIITKDWNEGTLVKELDKFVELGYSCEEDEKLKFINDNFSIEAMERNYLDLLKIL